MILLTLSISFLLFLMVNLDFSLILLVFAVHAGGSVYDLLFFTFDRLFRSSFLRSEWRDGSISPGLANFVFPRLSEESFGGEKRLLGRNSNGRVYYGVGNPPRSQVSERSSPFLPKL
jgi:hypothetical protein